jgi:hypothetical protein
MIGLETDLLLVGGRGIEGLVGGLGLKKIIVTYGKK